MQTLGAMLRERREAMGVSLAEVEVATRIRQKYLSAIESEEWHMLPGEVVGRGFLRNYADYLGLDPQEIMERRRAVTDMGMTQALSTTSAGAPLPPEREVDYRPKEVELKDEGDGIQRGEIRLTPILAIIGLAIAVGLGLWGLSALREPIGEMLAGAQEGVMGLFEPETEPVAEPVVTSDPSAAVVNEQNVSQAQVPALAATATAASQGLDVLGSAAPGADAASNPAGADTTAADATAADASVPESGESNAAGQPSDAAPVTDGAVPGDTGGEQAPTAGDTPPAQSGELILVPTATPEQVAAAPTPEAPIATPEVPTPTPEPPTPTLEPPTATPEVPPTETPTPEPPAPVVAAPACGDARSVISSPGVGQVLSGVAAISGAATHEAFQFYKLEFAPGSNAGGGFTYFGGGQVQIAGGVLGNLDTTVLPNGEYTIRLTVVDQVGNFPPPCDVSVVVQN